MENKSDETLPGEDGQDGQMDVVAKVRLTTKLRDDVERFAKANGTNFSEVVRNSLLATLNGPQQEGASGQAPPPPAIPPAVLLTLLSNVCEARWMAGEAMVNVYSAAAFSRQLLRRSVTDDDDVAALRTELNTSVQTAIANGKEAAAAYANEVLQHLGLITPEPSK